VAKHGEARAARMADTNRNMLIFPNLVVNDIMAVTVRTFMPLSPSRMDVTAWELAPRGELPQLRQRRLDSFLTFLGPAGFATPDDVEALESASRASTPAGWSGTTSPGAWRASRTATTRRRCARSGGAGRADGPGRLVGGGPVTACRTGAWIGQWGSTWPR